MAQRQSILERRISQLEAQLATVSMTHARPRPETRPDPAVPSQGPAIPKNLATVKLSPTERALPPVPTSIDVKEPDPETVAGALAESDGDVAGTPVANGDEWEAAMIAIRTGDVEGGARRLEAFADRNPRHEKADAALYAAGIGRQTSGDLLGAVLVFSRVAEDYPRSESAPDALVRMATCQLRLKKVSAARALFASVIDRYPGSKAARLADAELKELSRGSEATVARP
jgi:TolA-binding protein